MTIVRQILGHILLFLVTVLSKLCVGMIHVSAWLLDREDYSSFLATKIRERDEDHPLPKFEDFDG